MGVDPRPLSLRELWLMFDANDRRVAMRQAQLLCLIYNCNVAERSQAKAVKDFLPAGYAPERPAMPAADRMRIYAAFFGKGKKS